MARSRNGISSRDHEKSSNPRSKSGGEKVVQPLLLLGLYSGNIAQMSMKLKCVILALAVACGYVHFNHVSTLFENDRHFSHLSTLEREMTFRTEMGLYYSYFKTVIEEPTLLDGIRKLYADNLTEYPSTINTLKRFNLYPEVVVGVAFRGFTSLAESRGWKIKQCWLINRGEGLSQVWSCDGAGDPANFYILSVWVFSFLTTFFLFLISVELSDSIFGGLFSVLCFFFNHSESTRVMWTPPLRESFGYPIFLAQVFFVTLTLREASQIRFRKLKVLVIASLTCIFILFWQFAQFTLLTQYCCIFALWTLEILDKQSFLIILDGLMWGVGAAIVLMFGNEMLLSSWICLFMLMTKLILLMPEQRWHQLPKLVTICCKLASLVFGAVSLKIMLASVLRIEDDAHILEILYSKFGKLKNFHTMLYTCAREFDFLEPETGIKLSQTLLIPVVSAVALLITWRLLEYLAFTLGHLSRDDKEKRSTRDEVRFFTSAAVCYNFLQLLCFVFMAVIIMRLKLFMSPHLCILAGMAASSKVLGSWIQSREWQLALVAALVAGASLKGVANLREQHSIMGEYENIPMEEMIEWINGNVPPTHSLAGPMNVMANLLLSTRRPIINHPHYEDAGLRARTMKVYEVYSRRTAEEYHQTLLELQAKYLVLSQGYCMNGRNSNGCGMTDIWDLIEPAKRSQAELCPSLYHDKDPKPFSRVFQNDDYVILKV